MKDLTVGKEGRLILHFALPMLAGNLFQQLYNFVDSIIVGKFLGKEALAAVGASFPIIFTLIALIIGIATGGTIVIAQFFGAKDIEKVRRAIDTLFIFFFFASILFTAIGIVSSESIFRLIKLPEDIMPYALEYLNIYLMGLVVFFGFNATSAVLRGLGDSLTPLYFLIVSTILNIGFDLLFVVVFKWGIGGAAYATILSQALAFIGGIIYLNKTHKIIRFSLRGLVFDGKIFLTSLRIGVPTGLQHVFVSVGMILIMSIVNTFGTDVVAGYSAAMRIDSLAMLPAMNFGQALATFVGQNIGANKRERVKSGLTSTLLMSSVVSLVVTCVVILFGSNLMSWFTNDAAVISVGVKYLVVIGSFYLLFSIMFSINGVLRGAGDTVIPMLITLVTLWAVRIPLAWVLSKKLGFGETGIWWATPIAWAVGVFLSYLYYLSGNWKKFSVVKHARV
ncbi:MAG: MATE family efflux transporter [Bacteroidales bacterium]|nr:MATE family efflux transporter [Bacteroidales bacterium]